MGDFVLKTKRIIKEGCYNLKKFGPKVMWAQNNCILNDNSSKSLVNKNKILFNYLTNKYTDIIQKYNDKAIHQYTCDEISNLPMWILWWQGEDNMPDMIKVCYRSVLENSNGHPVILLHKDNIREYVDFPDYIWKLYQDNVIRVQHLADMIRIRLIKNYGGLWLDASIYCNRKITDDIFSYGFYSLKNKDNPHTVISEDRWTTFLIGGHKDNLLCNFLDECFMEYCKDNKPFVDYFMFDCLISIGDKNIPKIHKLIENVPYYEGNYRLINQHINDKVDDRLLSIFDSDNSMFYKISWNNSGKEIDKESLYNYIIKKELKNG